MKYKINLTKIQRATRRYAFATACVAATTAVVTSAVLGYKLYCSFTDEVAATRAIDSVDDHVDSVEEAVSAVDGDNEQRGEDDPPHPVPRFRGRPRGNLARALGLVGYCQFGPRPRTEADVLVTRKFLRDHFDNYPRVRRCDRAHIIDMAVELSYVRSTTAVSMDRLISTWSWAARSNRETLFTRWWNWVSTTPDL